MWISPTTQDQRTWVLTLGCGGLMKVRHFNFIFFNELFRGSGGAGGHKSSQPVQKSAIIFRKLLPCLPLGKLFWSLHNYYTDLCWLVKYQCWFQIDMWIINLTLVLMLQSSNSAFWLMDHQLSSTAALMNVMHREADIPAFRLEMINKEIF